MSEFLEVFFSHFFGRFSSGTPGHPNGAQPEATAVVDSGP